MIDISLCMIVKNEELVLHRCLSSVQSLVDEIIIVDTGSNDKTKEIAKEFTNLIYDFEWIDDFAAARNFAFSKATKKYVMWLDADDIIKKIDQKAFLKLKKTLLPNIDIVMMKYNIAFDINNQPTLSYYRERILKRENNPKWVGAIHEIIPLTGKLKYSDIAISHKKLVRNDPRRNLRIFEKMIKNGITLDPRQQFYYARELYYNKRYSKAITCFKKFLAKQDGWIENNIEACKDLALCYNEIDKPNKALSALYQSFVYDLPRAEICCDIASHYFKQQMYDKAIYWYKVALKCELNSINGGFSLPDCYDYIPYIQLCVCYDRLKDIPTAIYFNELAGKCKSNDPAYLYNKAYFDKLP